MRPRSPQASGRVIALEDRAELQCLLDEIPAGAAQYDDRICAFVAAWRRIHVPASEARYAIHRLPFGAVDELLDALRVALHDPELRIYALPNCDCERCIGLRGSR